MRSLRAIPGVLFGALLLAAPAWAQTDTRLQASSGTAVSVAAAEADVPLSAQEAEKNKKPKKPKKTAADEPGTKNGFVWADRPSLRFGKLFQMDFRFKS